MITHKLDFGTFTIHDRCMVGEFARGVDFDRDKLLTLKALSEEHFDGAFGYIANRVNSYSIDPCIYKDVGPINHLTSIAFVTYRNAQLQALQVERCFMPTLPTGSFFSLIDAINWTHSTLRQVESLRR